MYESSKYNLLDECWIPVLWNDGKTSRVGIKRALTEAGRIRDVAASNPMDRFAIIRFLLALLYWCRGNPPESISNDSSASFPKGWFAKLEDNKECFNLMGEGKRFYQYKNIDDKTTTVNYLIHEIPTGTNISHFHHVKDEKDGLCLPCCVLGLLRLPVFTTQGGQGKSPGINARPPIYKLYPAKTLQETLLRNLADIPASENEGTPAWVKPDVPLPRSGRIPLLTGLTWLPRRVWLDTPSAPVTQCSACGKAGMVVRRAVYGGLGSTKPDAKMGRSWNDPHVLNTTIKQKKIKSIIVTPLHFKDALSRTDAASGQWTNIVRSDGQQDHREIKQDKQERWIVGFASDQNKYFEAYEDTISSLDSAVHASNELEQWSKQGALLGDTLKNRLKALENAPKRRYTDVLATVATVRPHAEHEAGDRIDELLSDGVESWQETAKVYDPLLKAIADSLAPGFTTAALERQRVILAARPHIEPKQLQDTDGEQVKKQGGEE